MSLPLILSRPVPGRDDDRHFIQLAWQRRTKSRGRAKFLGEVAHFRTAQQYVEWTSGPAAFARDEMLHHLFLSGRHFIPRQRLETISHEFDITWIRFGCLRGDQRRDEDAGNNEH